MVGPLQAGAPRSIAGLYALTPERSDIDAITECVAGAQPVRPRPGLAQGLAGQERQAFATLLIEAAGSRGAVEADVFQMPQHRVHGRRPRLRGAADFVADAYGSETAPAGQPSFGHPTVLPRSGVHGDRIIGSGR